MTSSSERPVDCCIPKTDEIREHDDQRGRDWPWINHRIWYETSVDGSRFGGLFTNMLRRQRCVCDQETAGWFEICPSAVVMAEHKSLSEDRKRSFKYFEGPYFENDIDIHQQWVKTVALVERLHTFGGQCIFGNLSGGNVYRVYHHMLQNIDIII